MEAVLLADEIYLCEGDMRFSLICFGKRQTCCGNLAIDLVVVGAPQELEYFLNTTLPAWDGKVQNPKAASSNIRLRDGKKRRHIGIKAKYIGIVYVSCLFYYTGIPSKSLAFRI